MTKEIIGRPTWSGVVAEDFEAQRRFYRDLLGFKELKSGDGWVQFNFTPHDVFEIIAHSPRPECRHKNVQIGFSVSDIREVRDELVARGAKAVSDIEGGPSSGVYWCYFEDPEGNFFALLQRLDPPGPTPDGNA